ncbi:MAG: glycoside hydrolase family 88/105 protein [Cellulosilyticaceae bacterium]
MEMLQRYITELIEKSTPENPVWNIEKVKSGAKTKWNYIDGCMIKAILEMHTITKEAKYLEFADHFIDYFVKEDGSIKDYSVEEYNIDNVNAGKTLFELYELTGKEKYRKAIDTVYEQIKTQPRTKEGNFWHKKIYPHQIWLDGLYMAQPFYMEYETKFNGMGNYMDIYKQFVNVEKLLKDEKTGLYYHGYDASREIFWCDKETGLSQNFWLRALGWFVMALVDTLEKMDEQIFFEYRKLMSIFRELIDALLKYQDESGMWYQVVDQMNRAGNYLETSGSAIMAYGILKGVRLGYLPERYKAYGEKAFYGVCNRYLHKKDGELNLGGICLVAGLGGKEMRDGSFEYYISEPVVENEAKGVAPLLLAYTEVLRS